MKELKTVLFIGAGNVATHLSQAMQNAGLQVMGIYSRQSHSAQLLAKKLSCKWGNLSQIETKDIDLIVVSVPDHALTPTLKLIPPSKALLVHTSGSVMMEDLKSYSQKIGVFYPLQTFSKEKSLPFSNIPIMVETNKEEDLKPLENLAERLSEKVFRINSLQRKRIHIAAVFSCNFTNYLVHIAEDLLEKEQIPFDVIRPLIEETAEKLKEIRPYHAQTGPAVREDHETMQNHLNDLDDTPAYKEIYQLLSQHIIQSRKKENNDKL
ncbi:MAG: NADP oxidoreductase [Bacteroidetes bacterium 4572_77]|nr:MAG: NADP oxidoreductase [Bacteroidetes bacterium 4572_77]